MDGDFILKPVKSRKNGAVENRNGGVVRKKKRRRLEVGAWNQGVSIHVYSWWRYRRCRLPGGDGKLNFRVRNLRDSMFHNFIHISFETFRKYVYVKPI
jgi:hypothetical protein